MNLNLIQTQWQDLQTGTAVRVVRARPADAANVERFYLGLSRDSRYERFFSHRPEFTAEELHRLSHPDPARELCMIALAGEAGSEIVVGDARCVTGNEGYEAKDRAKDGEIALVVADNWRRQGIGRKLLCALISAARHDGYDGLIAYMTATNAGMRKLVREFNFRAMPLAGGATIRLVRKELMQLQYQPDPGCSTVMRKTSEPRAVVAA